MPGRERLVLRQSPEVTYDTTPVTIEPYDSSAYARWESMLTEPEFVIVGTGRSGTGYISQLLTRLGIRTGHEQWWNPPANRSPNLVGEASWLAVPHLADYEGKVGLQLRDPLKVMRSLLNGDLFNLARTNVYYRYKANYLDFCGDPILDAAWFVVEWTRLASEHADIVWRLEDLDPQLVAELTIWAGHPVDEMRVAAAMKTMSPDWNRHNRIPLEWEDLPDHPTIHRLRALAEAGDYA